MASVVEFKKEEIEAWVNEPIESFSSGQGTNKGDNVASEILRIQVKTVSGKVHNLVYKGLPPANNPDEPNFAITMKIFRRENQFYRNVAPAIESTVQNRLDQTKSTASFKVPIPKFYAGFNNDVDDFVCLGDLRPDGFIMPDKKIGLNLPQLKLVMKKTAEFHAMSYFYLKTAGEEIFLEEPNQPYLVKHWLYPSSAVYEAPGSEAVLAETAWLNGMISAIYKNCIDVIETTSKSPDAKKLAAKMRGKNDGILNQTYEISSSTTRGTDSKYFPLIIHGDFWLNNVLFSYDELGQPKDVKLVDFQFTRRGNIYEDLNYFIYCSTTAEFRRDNLNSALHVYYESFVETLNALRFPLPVGFSRGNFIDGFYENILPSYIFLAFALPLQIGSDGEIGEGLEIVESLKLKTEASAFTVQRMEEATREMLERRLL